MEPHKLLTRKRIVIVSIIAVLVVTVAFVMYVDAKLNEPSVGSVDNPSSSQQNAGLAFDFAATHVTGTTISFSYPKVFSVVSSPPPVSPITEFYQYKYKDIETWDLSLTVTRLESDSLRADSSYYSRLLNPGEYTQSTLTENGQSFVVMSDTKAAGFSEVAYSLHNGLSVDISLTGDDNAGTSNLQKVFQNVLKSFVWH
jgi:hypothetical protein